jgi:hypothetical protein
MPVWVDQSVLEDSKYAVNGKVVDLTSACWSELDGLWAKEPCLSHDRLDFGTRERTYCNK